MMKKRTVGILAHVDAGKTTLSESMLFLSGKIRKLGRVDNKDAYFDTDALERKRGITIFSKQAVMQFEDTEITLLDTPGHVDFSAEMERTLQVLDYAILVISATDGVQSHTRTVWELLENYGIPTFIFVNKMDQSGADQSGALTALQKELSDRCIAFGTENEEERMEMLALCDECLMDHYMEHGHILKEQISGLVRARKAFPVYFGSALRQIGVESFVQGLIDYTQSTQYADVFGAKVFKITRDPQGNRLTHMKITGGSLQVKDTIRIDGNEEKVNQIRIYSADKFETVPAVEAGSICAVTGLTKARPGEGLGKESISNAPLLEPVLSYQIHLPVEIDALQILPKLRELEEEEPTLRIVWKEELKAIHIQVMGAVQLEILQSIILERYKVHVSFGQGEIVYKETIAQACEGVGHFEPLRHYAEVHLLLEPGQRGSGLQYGSACSEDMLDKNWQNLVLTHLKERRHIGVLTGSYITDMKITLVAGRAHNKHTVGGDFRQATFRALRQGLKETTSVLLEPYYYFKLVLPEQMVGRAMSDIDKMHGTCTLEEMQDARAVLTGEAPVATLQNYQQEVSAYTKGEGRLSLALNGYGPCHNAEAVIEMIDYDSELDALNPTGSVFCSKGSGYLVPWDEVKAHMHVEGVLKPKMKQKAGQIQEEGPVYESDFISLEEIDEIINSTHFANQGKKNIWKKRTSAKEHYYSSLAGSAASKSAHLQGSGVEEYLLVDGYNIIHAWTDLEVMAKENMEAARAKLMDILSNYQPIRKSKIMLVFDAYRVEGGRESVETYHNIQVVYTAEAQTADHFIEKFAHKHKKKYRITVATSDGLQQVIIRGAGAGLISARELEALIADAEAELSEHYLNKPGSKGTSKLGDMLSEAAIKKLKETESEN